MDFPFKNISVLNIETTNMCNLNCLYCSKKALGKTEYRAFMGTGLLNKILDQFTNKKMLIALYLGGEPLLHPNLELLIQVTNNRGFKNTRIHTNGTLITKKRAESLLDSGISSIIFSIDGTDKEDYERIRKTSFDVVHGNLKSILDINNKRAEIGVQCLIGKGKAKKLNKDLKDLEKKLDKVILDRPHSWLGTETIPESQLQNQPEAALIPCLFLRSHMSISVLGQYLLCCRCLNREKVLGTVWERRAEEIWNTEMGEIRQQQIQNKLEEPCITCQMMAQARINLTESGREEYVK